MEGDDRPPAPPLGGRPSLLGIGLTVAGVGLLALVAVAVEPLRSGLGDALSGDTESLREELRELRAAGVLVVLALALAHAVVWFPAEILDAAAGFVYGFGIALPLVMAGWLANAIVAYAIGRHAARPALFRLFGRARFLRYEGVVRRGGVTLLLAMRLVPIVPFSLFSYVAGSAHVPVGSFLWTTAVGYLPITAVFVYVGSRLDALSPTDPVLWAGALVVLALLLLGRRVARMLGRAPAAPPPAARPEGATRE